MSFVQKTFYTYIMANRPYGTLYIGMTNGLVRRIEQHRAGEGSAFTRKYAIDRLVWFGQFSAARDAIQKEKTMKSWPRQSKINLIEQENPHWLDLYPTLPGVHSLTVLRN